MLMKRYEEGGEVEKTAADYDDERPEESLQSRIAMAQGARQTPRKPAARPMTKAAQKPASKAAEKSEDKPAEVVRRPGRPTHLQGRPYSPPKPIPGYESPLSRLDRTQREEDRAKRLDIARDESPARSPTFMSLRGQGMAKGGAVSASRRADGCAQRGKTRGKMI